MLNGLDVFSGIGGISIALSNWVCPVAYCENDRYAQSVLLSRMEKLQLPAGPIWDDIRTLKARHVPGPIDIMYGGFPCQDISVAGHGKGLEGKRSRLFFEVLRLADEIKPTFLFLENVPAIRTRGAEIVGKELSSRGYDCRWDVVSAAEVGATHKRSRWFLLAANTNSEALRIEQGRSSGENWEAQTFNTSISDIRLTTWSPKGGFESRVFGAGNGIPCAVDRDRALGNAVVPAQAREAFKRLMGL